MPLAAGDERGLFLEVSCSLLQSLLGGRGEGESELVGDPEVVLQVPALHDLIVFEPMEVG